MTDTPNVLQLPAIGRSIGQIGETDVPSILDELAAHRAAEEAALHARFRSEYESVRAKVMASPVLPDGIDIGAEHINVPGASLRAGVSLVAFDRNSGTWPAVYVVRALTPSLISTWASSHPRAGIVEQWVREDAELLAHLARGEAERARLAPLVQAACEGIARRVQRDKAEKEAASLREQDAQRRQITDWVAQHGTANQQRRYTAGLLPKDEVVAGMRDQAFAPLSTLVRYERMKQSEVRAHVASHGYEIRDDADVEFDAEDCETATADEFDLMKSIRGMAPGAELRLRNHVGQMARAVADDEVDEPRLQRKSLLVTLKVGAFSFSREYAVPQPGR